MLGATDGSLKGIYIYFFCGKYNVGVCAAIRYFTVIPLMCSRPSTSPLMNPLVAPDGRESKMACLLSLKSFK